MLHSSSFWLATATAFVIGTIFLTRLANLARRKKSVSGESLIGEIGEAQTDLSPDGTVSVRSRSYRAASGASIPAGERVRVTGIGDILSVELYKR